MSKNIEFIVGIISMIIIVMIAFGGPIIWNALRCHAKYDDSYSPVEYGVFSGCRATFNGKLIPVERIREGD